MNNNTMPIITGFVKPFSRGQITIPQNMRKQLGITLDDWLFLTVKDNCLIIKPVRQKNLLSDEPAVIKAETPHKQYLLFVNQNQGKFGQAIADENKKVRQDVAKSMVRTDW